MNRGTLILVAIALGSQTANAQSLVVSLSNHRVLVGSTYTGAQIAVFGGIERDGRTIARADPYDIAVTVTGPRKTLVVREKSQVGPFWLNTERRRFWEAPTFLAALTTRPIGEMGNPADARRLSLGLRNRLTRGDVAQSFDLDEGRFVEALIRLKGAEQLYTQVERGVTFLTPAMFRAAVVLPATAPPGNYEVQVELLSGGVRLANQQTNFEVVQIGFEQTLASFARNWGLFYGLATAALAMFFGWLATIIFRRD
jgi:uncharacterized protein (TIGR02186 family)